MTYIDLTQIISQKMPVYPGTEPPHFTAGCTIENDGFREMEVTMYTHTGTHMDSPAHLFQDGLTLDRMRVDRFIGKGLIVDCGSLTPGEQISVELLEPYKNKLTEVEFALLHTGWSKKWGHDKYFQDYPSLSKDAARLLAGLKLKGVGIDAISVEPITNKELIIHQILLKQNLVIIENLTNLGQLIGKDFTFSCFPLKIAEADGSPVRAVAMTEKTSDK